MNIGTDFYVVQFILENTAKTKQNKQKTITYVNLSILSILKIYFAFYQR